MSCRRTCLVLIGVVAIGVVACGGGTTGPGPINPPPGPTPTPNQTPVIRSITVSSERIEMDGDALVTADVTDAETPSNQLTYTWKADAGTFDGAGASVTWRAPRDQPTPRDYTISLTVTEVYGPANNTAQNVTVGQSPTIRVHNTRKELSDMGLTFLHRFGDSSVSPQTCVADFAASCPGRNVELEDIERNRRLFIVLDHTLETPRVNYTPGRTSAEVIIRASYTSRIVSCNGWPVEWGSCSVGRVDVAKFDDHLPSIYEQGRWWFCDSKAQPLGTLSPAMRGFLGIK